MVGGVSGRFGGRVLFGGLRTGGGSTYDVCSPNGFLKALTIS